MLESVTLTVRSGSGHSPSAISVGELNEFKLKWLHHVHKSAAHFTNDFFVAYAIFDKFVMGVDLDFDATMVDMAAVVGLSRRSLQKAFRRLEAAGLLETTVRYGRSAVNTFIFTLPPQNQP